MPTPPKPAKVLKLEGRSHRTKKELAQRERGEAATLSGERLIESAQVKENLVAHREFLRVRRLLTAIEKNDGLYTEVINRYCLLKAECQELSDQITLTDDQMRRLEDAAPEMGYDQYLDLSLKLTKKRMDLDARLQQKRKMMFDIEKENIMTVASALRSVQKKVEKKNPLLEALNG